MVKVALRPIIHFNILKNKSQLTSTGVSLISKSLFADTEFSSWIAKVAGNEQHDKDQILQAYLNAGTNMIDHILENKDDPGLELLRKAIESSDPKYNDVSIAINYPDPTTEGPVFKTYALKPMHDFTLDTDGRSQITEAGENHIYDQWYGNTQGRNYLEKLANKDGFREDMVKGAKKIIDDTLEQNNDYKLALEDWVNDRMQDNYKKIHTRHNISYTIAVQIIK